MKKKIMSVAALFILAFNSIVFVNTSVNAEQAREIATKYVPAGIAHIITEYEAHKKILIMK
ncbi:MAG: hypothetical protein LUF25_02605 [Phascolarctobacterium sp.]|nr:hypothetical protein [Phascolarctobacterium sp.]